MDFHLYAWRHHLLRPHQFILMVCTAIRDAICNSYAGVTPIQEVTPREPDQLANLYSDDFNSRWAARCAYQILYTLHDHPVRGGLFFQRMIERHKMRCEVENFLDALPDRYQIGHLDQRLSSTWACAHFIEFAGLCPVRHTVRWGFFVHAFGARDGHSPTVQRVVLDSFFNE